MTKIKNTKKGMAKKTLSMSLVVAMLATSNVPVWAAEFSDGSDVAVATETPVAEEFNDDADATPVVDDTENAAVAEETSVESKYDFSNVKLTANPAWDNSGKSIITGTIKDDKGVAIAAGKLKYDWIVDGVKIGNYAKDASDLSNTSNVFKLDKSYIGSSIKVRFYDASETNTEDKTVKVYDLGTIQAVDISSVTMTVPNATSDYCGKVPEQTPTIQNNSFGLDKDDFTYNYNSTNGANAGSTVTVTATLKPEVASEKGYKGQLSATYKIVAVSSLTPQQVDITVTPKTAGEYTGSKIELSTSDVVVKIKDTDVVLPVKKVETKASAATVKGTTVADNADLLITFDEDALKATGNFTSGFTTTASKAVSITQRDLKKCSAKLNVTYTKTNVNASGFTVNLNRLDITDANGKKLNLQSGDVTISVKAQKYDHVGTYQDAITILANKDGNCINSTTADLVISEKNFDADSAAFENAAKLGLYNTAADAWTDSNNKAQTYENKEITFTKDQLGNFLPKGKSGDFDNFSFNFSYSNNTNASTEKNLATLTVTGKAGSDYEGCSKTFYFKIKPAEVKATTDKKTTTVTTAVKDTVKGVEVVENASAADYKKDINLVLKAQNAKTDLNPEVDTFDLAEGTDYTCEYSFVKKGKSGFEKLDVDDDSNVAGQYVKIVATLKNSNYAVAAATISSSDNNVQMYGNTTDKTITVYVPLVEKTIANTEVTLDKDSYVYTGETIVPKVTVKAGNKVLKEGTDYSVTVKNGIDVGTATVIITALDESGYRPGSKITKDFTITKAKTSDLIVEIQDKDKIVYNGKAWIDGSKSSNTVNYTLKLGQKIIDNSLFKVTWGDNVDAGKTAGKFTLTPKTSAAKNFEGTKDVTFEIKGETATGTLKIYDDNGKDITSTVTGTKYYYTGSPITFDNVIFTGTNKKGGKLVKDKDYQLVYVDNTDAGTAYVAIVGKGNYVGNNTITKADGTKLDNVIASLSYTITGAKFSAKHITVSNGVYASGLVVKPNVSVVVNGETLVEGKDYELSYDTSKAINATEGKTIKFVVKGIHKYAGTVVDSAANGDYLVFGIDKFDLKNASVTSDGKTVTVRNGNVVVPSTEYTYEIKDGKVTVTATEGNKNYTGTITTDVNNTFVGAPIISNVKVVGNGATVVLSDEAEGASGYDYVISTSKDPSDKDARIDVVKNQVQTTANFKYVPQGTYYAYCHAWTRDENGKKVFGGWSNSYAFSVTAITPDTPEILSVKTKGSTITVTYKESANSTGYDVVLGKGSKKEHGETRPYQYGKYKKLNVKPGVCKAVFKNIPAGTYYAGVHSWNRTASENDNKVFSKWSNLETAKVK